MKILILGSTGLIGYGIFSSLFESGFDVYGTSRNEKGYNLERILNCGDVLKLSSYISIIERLKPNIVINCIGITKHVINLNKFDDVVNVNILFPYQISNYCNTNSIKFIHISTDCVYQGLKGNYNENDCPDSFDFYGISKSISEIACTKSLVIRTSTIGFELNTKHGLLEWFLSQKTHCVGYKNAIFSGLPTKYLAQVISKFIFNNLSLSGIYNISSQPISKFDLLHLFSQHFSIDIRIEPNSSFVINRSLDSTKFSKETGYTSHNWNYLVNYI